LRNAGANVVDQPAVVDANILTSRNPDDVEAFTQALVEMIESGVARDTKESALAS
jgi:protease I